MVIGYLSPIGKFYSCLSYGHTDLALSICQKLYKSEITRFNIIDAEKYLLDLGYICFRARDVIYVHLCSKNYCNHLNTNNKLVNIISESQHNYIKNIFNSNSWNNLDQLDSMNRILNDNQSFESYLKKDSHLQLNPILKE